MQSVAHAISVLLIFCATASAQVPLRVFDQLGPGQVTESVKITIGDHTKTIELDAKVRSAYVDFILPGPGLYNFSLDVRTKLEKNWFKSAGKGSGTLTIRGGEVMNISPTSDVSESPYQCTLIQIGVIYGYQQLPFLPSDTDIYKDLHERRERNADCKRSCGVIEACTALIGGDTVDEHRACVKRWMECSDRCRQEAYGPRY